MDIGRHNCEAVFLDYYEKKLTPVEVAELLCFLEEHPDLKELFESYEEIQAVDEIIHFEEKETLKKKYIPEELDRILNSDIDKNNCEYFFVANAEGILSAEKLQQLNVFLERYPEYKKEQELFLKCRLSPNDVAFEGKENLKKILITHKNKEEYFIRSIDKDLSRAEEEQLTLFLLENPELKKEYALFAKTVLPDEPIVFENKESLKKQKRKPVLIPLFYQRAVYYAAAASVLLLVGLFFFSKENTSAISTEVAYNKSTPANSGPVNERTQQQEKKTFSEQSVIASTEQKVNINVSQSAKTISNSNSSSVQTASAVNKPADNNEQTILEPFILEDEASLLANAEQTILPFTQEEEIIALAKAQNGQKSNVVSTPATAQLSPSTDDYQTIGSFTRKKIKKALGINQVTPCDDNDKITMWDVVVATKNGIQKMTGNKSLEVNKICNGEGDKVEYIFAAGNLRITRSASK